MYLRPCWGLEVCVWKSCWRYRPRLSCCCLNGLGWPATTATTVAAIVVALIVVATAAFVVAVIVERTATFSLTCLVSPSSFLNLRLQICWSTSNQWYRSPRWVRCQQPIAYYGVCSRILHLHLFYSRICLSWCWESRIEGSLSTKGCSNCAASTVYQSGHHSFCCYCWSWTTFGSESCLARRRRCSNSVGFNHRPRSTRC